METETGKEQLPVHEIVQKVARVTGIPPRSLMSHRRDALTTKGRAMLFHLIDIVRNDLTITTVARLMQRDHSTMSHMRNRWREYYRYERQVIGWMQHDVITLMLARAGVTENGVWCEPVCEEAAT